MLSRASLRLVWPVLAVAWAGACGTTPAPDGSDGASGGTSGSGTDSGGSQSSGGGSNTGGQAPSSGGGTVGSGGESGGSGGTGPGGEGGLGGADGGQYVAQVGDSCSEPGAFACASNNELLALICGGDDEWEARETCELGERCDAFNAATAGVCRAVLPDCELGSDEPFCGDTGVEVCQPGGFDTEVLEACGAEDVCANVECLPGPDECPISHAVGCGEDCPVDQADCVENPDCDFGARVYLDGGSELVRLSGDITCTSNAPTCPERSVFEVYVYSKEYNYDEEHEQDNWVRVTLGPGWEMHPVYLDESDEGSVCRPGGEECLMLAPAETDMPSGDPASTMRFVRFYPLTDPPIERNVLFEAVPAGTTCD